jgi:hypothetical protein
LIPDSHLGKVKYHKTKGISYNVMVHAITRFIVECVGVITDLQILLFTIDRIGVSIMSTIFKNRRVTHLRSITACEKIHNIKEYFGKSVRIVLGRIVS